VDLSTENPDVTKESVREYVWEYQLPYAVGWATPEVVMALMNGRESIPQTFVVGKDGRILTRFIGFSTTNTKPKLREAIENALKAEAN
jgi:hypothetical protein